MEDRIRRKLAMACRVRDFSRSHPSPAVGYTQTMTRLEERVTRALTLATQQQTGRLAARASTASKTELRHLIHEENLKHLARIARGAAAELPELSKRFRVPRADVNNETFLAATRAMAEQAGIYQEIFIRDGMPFTFLDELNQSIEQYEATITRREEGKALHVGARADLPEVLHQVMLLVKRLDGINRFRFRHDPEMLAAWASARKLSWATADAAGTAPAGGEMKPAA